MAEDLFEKTKVFEREQFQDEGGVFTPDEYPGVWDALRYGEKLDLAPGIATVKVARTQKLDVRQPSGSDSASLFAMGYEPAKVTITLTIWKPAHFEALPEFFEGLLPQKSLDPPANKKSGSAKAQKKEKATAPLAVMFSHPVLKFHKLQMLAIESIDGPSAPGSNGICEITISALQWFPAPPPQKEPSGAKKVSPALQLPTAVQVDDKPMGPKPPWEATPKS